MPVWQRHLHAGNVSTIVDANVSRGHCTAIAVGADGLPIIGHQEVSTGALIVTHCGSTTCTAGNASPPVDDQVNFVGQFTAIAIRGIQARHADLSVVRAGDTDGPASRRRRVY